MTSYKPPEALIHAMANAQLAYSGHQTAADRGEIIAMLRAAYTLGWRFAKQTAIDEVAESLKQNMRGPL